jgi:hypothetical protein
MILSTCCCVKKNPGHLLRSDQRIAQCGAPTPRTDWSRTRDAHYWAPPAQIRTCSFPAYGSHLGSQRQTLAVCGPAPVTRLPGTESGACLAGPRSPWPPPLAPPAPQRIAPRCSPASQLLWRSPTSRVRASSASTPRLPDADRRRHQVTARRGISRFRRDPCARDVALDPGGTTMPRITALLMLRSTMKTVSAPASRSLRGSLPHPTHQLCTLRVRRRRRLTQHSPPGGLPGPTWAGLAPADRASLLAPSFIRSTRRRGRGARPAPPDRVPWRS